MRELTSAEPDGRLPVRLRHRLAAHRVLVVASVGCGASRLLRRLADDTGGRLAVGGDGTAALEALDEAAATRVPVVIDELHREFAADGWPGLARAIATAPGPVIAASRTPIPDGAAALDARRFELVTGRELALRVDEIATRFRRGCGRPISYELASRIATATAGWPLLVDALLAEARTAHPELQGDAVGLALETDATAVVLEDFLATLSAPLVDALERTSGLPRLEVAACTELIGAASTAELLRALDSGVVMHARRLGHRELPPLLRRQLRRRTGLDAEPHDSGSAGFCASARSETVATPRAAAAYAAAGDLRALVAPTVGTVPQDGSDGGSEVAFGAAIRRLRAGDVVSAARLLRRVGGEPPAAHLGALTLLLVLRAAVTDPETLRDGLAAIERECVDRGLGAQASVVRGALAACDESPAALREAVESCERRDDPLGAATVAALALVMHAERGCATAGLATAVAARASSIGAADVTDWADAWGALLVAAGRSCEAPAAARRARTRAAASSVGALQLLAETASALASDPDGAPERVRAVRRAAREQGLLRLPLPVPASRPMRSATAGPAAPAPAPAAWPGVAAPRRPLLTVRCFGGFGLRVDGTELDLRAVRPQARAVLRILALNCGGAVHRELLAEVLWGRLDGEAAIHALHVSISSLRRGLAGTGSGDASFVEREGEAYRLELGDRRDCDLGSFDAGLQAAATAKSRGDAETTAAELRRATALYTGEVLPEDGPAEWVVGARERYRTRAAEASASLAHLELHLGDTAAAVAAATRAVEIDPWLDQGWRTLVAVHRSSGDAVAARRAEAGYRRMLGALGVE